MATAAPVFHSDPLFTVEELGLQPNANVERALAVFADRCEGVVSCATKLGTGTLLLLSVPEDPQSGALHFFDRQKQLFFRIDCEGEPDGAFGADDFERLARNFRRSQQAFEAEPVKTAQDLKLGPRIATDKAIFAFLADANRVAFRWVQFPAGVLLFAAPPDRPEYGAIYLFDRREGVFFRLTFPGGPTGLLSPSDFDHLIRQCRLFTLLQRPRQLRSRLGVPKAPISGHLHRAQESGKNPL